MGRTQAAKAETHERIGRAACTVELAQSLRSCSVARCVGASVFEVLDERAQLGQDLMSIGVVEKNPRRCDSERRQERSQSPVRNRRLGERAGHLCKSYTLDRRSKECGVVVRNERPGDDCLDRLVAVDKRPGCDRSIRAAHAQAGVATQVIDAFRPLPSAQIIWAANDHEREWLHQPYRDHVGGDKLAQPDAGVKTLSCEVDQFLTRGDFHFDLGIGLAEGCDQRLQQYRHYRTWHCEAEESSGPLSELTRDLACCDQLLEGGLCAREESFARFRKTDATRRARKERRADAGLERAHGLANRRWRHAEFCGRSAKAPMVGNTQKRLDTVERAVPHCEVLLHSPSTLSRIVAREK